MKRLFLDLDLCIGCEACSVACHRVNRGALTMDRTLVPAAGNLPVICRHCTQPACLAACPREAIYRDEAGRIRRAPHRCSGCRSCVNACPFGVITPGLDLHTISKCDLCAGRDQRGLGPACVATCSAGALRLESTADIFADPGTLTLGSREIGHNPYRRRG